MDTVRRPAVPDTAMFGLLLGLLTLVLMTISPLTLVHLGFSYDEPGGNPLEKIHPATLFAVAIVLLAAISAGNSRVIQASMRNRAENGAAVASR